MVSVKPNILEADVARSWSVRNLSEQLHLQQAQKEVLVVYSAQLERLQSDLQACNAVAAQESIAPTSNASSWLTLAPTTGTLAISRADTSLERLEEELRGEGLSRKPRWNRRRSSGSGQRPSRPGRTPNFVLTLRSVRFSKIWTAAARQAEFGWDFRIRSYNIRPGNMEIFVRCRLGDLDGMQWMVDNGRASALDVNEYGESLLEVSLQIVLGP